MEQRPDQRSSLGSGSLGMSNAVALLLTQTIRKFTHMSSTHATGVIWNSMLFGALGNLA